MHLANADEGDALECLANSNDDIKELTSKRLAKSLHGTNVVLNLPVPLGELALKLTISVSAVLGNAVSLTVSAAK